MDARATSIERIREVRGALRISERCHPEARRGLKDRDTVWLRIVTRRSGGERRSGNSDEASVSSAVLRFLRVTNSDARVHTSLATHTDAGDAKRAHCASGED